MPRLQLSRREILQKCFAAGLLTAASPLPAKSLITLWQEREARKYTPTPSNVLGPFYKKSAPRSTRLVLPGDPGIPLVVSGAVVDTRGELVPEARLEIWHADHLGHYDLDGYRCRALLPASEKAEYRFETVMPGHYPDRVAQHIHYLVSAPGHKTLVTQLYFATDPVFEGDPARNFSRDPLVGTPELIRPVVLLGDAQSVRAAVTFPICLERS